MNHVTVQTIRTFGKYTFSAWVITDLKIGRLENLSLVFQLRHKNKRGSSLPLRLHPTWIMIYNIMQIKMSQYGSMEYGATRGCSWILYPSRLDSVGPRKSFLMGSRGSQVLKMTVWILNINSWGIFYGHLPSSLSNFLNFENPAAAWVKRLFSTSIGT